MSAENPSQNQTGAFPGSPTLRTLVTDSGEQWLKFRRTLKPRYWVAWSRIAVCIVMITGGMAVACVVNARWGTLPAVLSAPIFGLWIGFWLHPLMLFGHEAAHYHLAPKRSTNDRLANIFVMSLFGLDVKLYRTIHWQHHLHLGNPHDTEISYHNRPSAAFLLQAFTGIYPIRALFAYYRSLTDKPISRQEPTRSSREKVRWFVAMARTAVIHLVVLGLVISQQWFGAALAWLAGLVVFFPAFHVLRQILEHRAVHAVEGTDYRQVEHGAVNRMFPTDLFSSTFGGAGFNRHLLHHWDPGVSYTRFDDMETFLLRCGVAADIDTARSTYWQALRSLARRGHAH